MVKGKSFVSGGLAGYSALFGLLMFCLAFFGLGFSVDNAIAEGEANASANASVTVSSACTMVGTTNTAHTASLDNGAFRENIGETVLTANCNDNDGIAIYAVGFTGETIGVNYLRDNGLFNTYGNTYDIQTGVGQSGDSKWAMKLTAVSNSTDTPSIVTGYDDYHTVPSEYTLVASKNSGTTTSGGASIKATYSAYVSGAQPAGVYEGKVKYVLVHPSTNDTNSFVVNFVANGGTGTMSSQKISRGVATALSANSFTAPSGLRFGGWNTALDGSGTTYANSAQVTNLAAAGESVSLYAIWQEVCAGYTTMQSLTSSSIATLLPNEHSTATVCDVRDEQTYTIAKLKDGKYWMVENLNIAGGTALSADDTDVTSAYISSFSTSNNLTKTGNTIVLPASLTSGFDTNNYSYVYNSSNKTNCGASDQNTLCYSYYSWDAATLGSGRTISTENTDAEQSICPKGWKLPTSRTTSASNWQTTSDFYTLAHQYGLDRTTSTWESDNGFYTQAGPGTTPNFLFAGYYSNGSFIFGGQSGYYWSSTSAYTDTSGARVLFFDSSYVDSAASGDRRCGKSVRCLFSGQ